MTLREIFHDADDVSRRGFLSGAASTMLGLGAMPLLSQAAVASPAALLRKSPAKNVIYLFMSGGMTHLDTFDVKPGAATQGPTEAIQTSADGVRISSHLKYLSRHMDKCVVLNSMSSTQGAHAQGQYFMHTSYEPRGTIAHASLGSWVNRLGGRLNQTLPGYVTVGGGRYATAGWMESAYAPLPIGDPEDGLANSTRSDTISDKDFHRRLDRVAKMNKAFSERFKQKQVRSYTEMYDQAVKLMGSTDLRAFDIDKEPDAIKGAYGDGRLGRGCLLARRLVEHGVRFVEVVSGGWDTHNDNFGEMEEKLPPLDRALSALLADLDARGLLEETLVVVATEFGRTPDITANRGNGRNHYPKAFSCLLAGGGVQGGQAYGKTDPEGREVIENKVLVPDLNATIAYALGLPTDKVLHSPSGRPFQIAHKGKPVTSIF